MIFDKYFNKEFEKLKPNIETTLPDGEDILLISGDFYGIQKFIFENLSTKNAAKVLRAKSAFVELFAITLARFICKKLNIEEKYILVANAGKFEIISTNLNTNIIGEVQKIVDNYFITNFYGLSGVNICYVECTKTEFTKNYKDIRSKISQNIELKKFNKLDLLNQNCILKYDANITNESLCKICNIRKKEDTKENCKICNMFVELGKWLVDSNKKSISSKNDLLIELEGFDTNIELTNKIKSYIAKDTQSRPIDFKILSEQSKSTNALGVLKADVDGMGNFIKTSDITEKPENFNMFSKTLDNFFSVHVPNEMRQKYKNSYTIFAGGDDLFIAGGYDTILDLARWIESEFKKFIKTKELTISFGIAIAKPSTPISYLAEHSEHLLELSKEMAGKDAISLFGETVKWTKYNDVFKKLSSEFDKLKEDDINTAFLYRLLEFCDMRKNINDKIENALWKSKLNYSFTRNMDKKHIYILEALNVCIENSPCETKMFLCEFIYKRRGVK